MTAAGAPLRLGIDATPLLGARTGIGTFTAELLAGLATDPSVAVTAYAATWRGRGQLAAHLPGGIGRVRAPMAARPLRAAWARGWCPLEWWTGPLDVAHGTNYVVPATRAARRLVTVHDLTVVRFPELCTPDTLGYPELLRAAFAAGAHAHTDSAFVAAEVCEHFQLPPERVHTVALGVSPLPPAPEGLGADLAGSERYVLALGTAEPRKDLPTLVAAFDLVAATDREVNLVLAGPDGWGRDALVEAIGRAAHRNRIVRLARYVSDVERAALLRGAAVFAYPSRYEGFGLPPLEAMAAGTPVVATRTGSLPEVLGDAAVLCDVGDPVGLAGALSLVLTDPLRAAELTAAGARQAADYTWAATCTGLLRLYRHLLDTGYDAVPSSG